MQSLLDKSLTRVGRLDWEKGLYLLFILLALASRLWGLGVRVQSHDESIHTKYSWHLYDGQGFSHHPLMHGPFLFHVTALSYFFFGDNDFAARVPVALMGVLIVAFPYLMRRWLGRKGALAASFFLLISPSIAYYSRYIRHDIPAILWALVAILAFLSYLRAGRVRWLYLMAGGVSLMFASKEVAFIYSAIVGFFLVLLLVVQSINRMWINEQLKLWFLIALSVVVVGLLLIGLADLYPTFLTGLPGEEAPTPLEQPLAEQPGPDVPWLPDVLMVSGIVLAVIALCAAIILLLGGQLSFEDLRASQSFDVWPMTLLAMLASGLFALTVNERLGALPVQTPDWLAIFGGLMAAVLLLGAAAFIIVNYLLNKHLRPFQFYALLLVVLFVVVGVVFRVGLPVLVSYSSCAGGDLSCVRQSLQQHQWPKPTVMPETMDDDGQAETTEEAAARSGIVLDTGLLLTILPFAGGLAATLAWFGAQALRRYRSFDLIILLGTLCLPLLSPLLMRLVGLDAIAYNPPTIYYTGAIALEAFLLSVVIGLLWDFQRHAAGETGYTWLTSAAIYYGLFVAFFTTFLTNPTGIPSGIVGALGYWLKQQEVERGGQPRYYYVIMVGLYEYLPLLLSLIAPVYLAVRAWIVPRIRPQAKRVKDFLAVKEYFLPFVMWWVVLTWIGYSMAGERMPWLTVHVALPMIFLGAWLAGRLLAHLDWRAILQKRTWLLFLLAPPMAIALVLFVDALSNRPFQGHTLAQLQTSGQFVNALLGIAICGAGLGYVFWRSGWRLSLRVLLLIALLVPVFVTIRTAWRFCYVNYDYATEFLVYAHAAPGVRDAVELIEEISHRYGGGPYAIDVPYGAEGSTLFHWQLRHYPPDHSFGENPTSEQLDAPVIIAGRNEWGAVDRYVGNNYITREYMYIWWPMQDYWHLNWERIRYAILNPEMRAALWDIWYDRDYARYDAWKEAHDEPSSDHTLDDWPLRGDFRLYIRRDVAQQVWDLPFASLPAEQPAAPIPSDPYAEGWQDLTARQVFGESGGEPGQLKNPRGIEISPAGSVYVADAGNNRIQKFTPDGQLLTPFVSGFLEPWDVAIAPDASFYVADTWNHRIQALDSAGNVLNMWGTYGEHAMGANTGQGAFFGPRGIAIGPDERLYVADTGNKRIQVFETDGQFVFQWGGGGAVEGYLDEPVGIAAGPSGEIYVVDTWNQRVQVFDRNGGFLRQWPIEGWNARESEDKIHLAHEEKPYLDVDAEGYVYVTDPGNARVLVFDAYGTYMLSFGKYGTDDGSFLLPTGIAVAEDGSVYVTDAHSDRVLVFDPLDLPTSDAEAGLPAELKLKYPTSGVEIDAGELPLLGTGKPGTTIHVLVDGEMLGEAVVDQDGVWALTLEFVEPGVYDLYLEAFAMQESAEGVSAPELIATTGPIPLVVRDR